MCSMVEAGNTPSSGLFSPFSSPGGHASYDVDAHGMSTPSQEEEAHPGPDDFKFTLKD